MTTSLAKLGAMTAAACLVAAMALPAYASTPDDAIAAASESSTQVLGVSAASASTVVRDGYQATAAPARAAAPARVKTKSVNPNLFVTANPPAIGFSGSSVLSYASQFVGVVPYGMGNNPASSFSCDGYTQYVFAAFGISLPRGADHQAALGVRISKADAVAGDFVWWPGAHIGIYDGAGGMYNSPTWGRYVEHVPTLWGSPVFIRLG